MTKKQFIDLVNLLIDDEISESDRALLEKEIEENPSQLKVLNNYRRLQKASGSLLSRHGMRLASSIDLLKYQMLARHSALSPRRTFLSAGGALIAACLTVVAAVRVFHQEEARHGVVAFAEANTNSSQATAKVELLHMSELQSMLASFSSARPQREVSTDLALSAHPRIGRAIFEPMEERGTIISRNATGAVSQSIPTGSFYVALSQQSMMPQSASSNVVSRVIRSSKFFEADSESAFFEFQR